MSNFEIDFQYPWMLVLLVLIPIAWWIGMRSLSGLGPVRRALALVLRSLVLLLVIAALAGVQWIWTSERQTVIYLLDQSDSIPLAKRQLMLRYAIESVKKFRRTSNNRNDRAGLIIFGREASIEIPPLDENLPPLTQPESYLGKTDATNIEGALKLAAASFLEDSAKRIVILTDGNQTLGSAETTAKRLAETGIGIDVVPVRLDTSTEVLVEKVDVPGYVRQGQTVEARVVINRFQEPGTEPKEIEGRLRVLRRIGNQLETLVDAPYTLDRDINVIPIPHRIEETAGYTYEAEFTTKDRDADTIGQNNRATAFTYARGRGRVMLIEDANNPGNFDTMVEALRRNDIDVDVRNTGNLFTSLVELQTYDSVVLAGVPRSSGENVTEIVSITEEQMEMLVQSVQQFGMGLLMLGGPEAFGAGGWANTKIEAAMPVNFAIKNTKIEAVGALAMVMHASEMAEGNYWQKMVGKAALESLGPQDYCGVIQYDMQGDKWLWGTATQGLSKV
ncbi:MAG: VWA domain-containing protein, partial [Planctomycetota bacterium]